MAKYEMTRGDYKEIPFQVPIETYEAGGKVFFTARTVLTDSTDDSDAAITVDVTDADIDSTDASYVYYTLVIPSAKTNSLVLGADKKKFIAELQWVSPSGKPTTYDPFDLVIKRDAGRRVA